MLPPGPRGAGGDPIPRGCAHLFPSAAPVGTTLRGENTSVQGLASPRDIPRTLCAPSPPEPAVGPPATPQSTPPSPPHILPFSPTHPNPTQGPCYSPSAPRSPGPSLTLLGAPPPQSTPHLPFCPIRCLTPLRCLPGLPPPQDTPHFPITPPPHTSLTHCGSPTPSLTPPNPRAPHTSLDLYGSPSPGHPTLPSPHTQPVPTVGAPTPSTPRPLVTPPPHNQPDPTMCPQSTPNPPGTPPPHNHPDPTTAPPELPRPPIALPTP